MKIAYNPITAEALTTAPANNDITFDLRGLNIFVKGVKFKGTDTTYSVFKKHTSSSGGGYNGLVPVPSYTSTNVRFLREDGTWQIPSSQYTYSQLTNQDLDTLKTEGKWFYLADGNTVTNGPTNINGGGELYVGRNASGYRYQKVILADGLIWFRIWNSSSWSDWKRWYTDANTDSKVLQSATTTTNYRPLVLGYNNSTSVSSLADSVTQQVCTTTNLYVQPSTGSLWANKLYSGGKAVLTDHQSLSNYVTLNTAQTITGTKTFGSNIQFNGGYSIYWNNGTYQQRISITDDSTAGTPVFNFQQSTNTGSSWTNLLQIYDNGILHSNGYARNGSSDSQVLLGGGGAKNLSDFAMSSTLGNYVTINTTQTITGQKTFTNPINNSYSTNTYLAGNQGKALINSTAGAGAYVMLFKGNSTNGYFTHGVYQGSYLLQYTAKTTVDAGTNAVTRAVTLLDESGNSYFPGNVTAPKFIGALQGNADTATKLTTSAGSATRPIYFVDGKPVAGTYTFGNANGNAAINNGTLNSNLNADMLDGQHSSYFLTKAGVNNNGGTGYVTNDTHIMQLGYMTCSSTYDSLTLQFQSAFGGNQHGSSDIIWLCQDLNTNGAQAVQVSACRLKIGYHGNNRIFYYKIDSTNKRVYLYVYVTGGNSYGRWISQIISSSNPNMWVSEIKFNQPNTGLTTIQERFEFESVYSATRLSTPRQINGTSFNGTANITTSYWGTSRTLTIGNTGKSVNGSGNVSWSLSEIGAAASSHTHPLSQISDLHSSWDALLKAAPSAYVTSWPSISEVTNKYNLVIKLNGGTTEGTNRFTYNVTSAKTVNITPSLIGAASSSHTHTISQISDLNSNWDNLLKNNPSSHVTRWPTISEVTSKQNLVIKLNGGTTEDTNMFTYNATTAKTINITASTIGAASSSHTHSYLPLSGGTLTGNLTTCNIYPLSNNQYDIGSVTSKYRNVYTQSISSTGGEALEIASEVILSDNINPQYGLSGINIGSSTTKFNDIYGKQLHGFTLNLTPSSTTTMAIQSSQGGYKLIQSSGATCNMPGVLWAAHISGSGHIQYQWGNGCGSRTPTVSRIGVGWYKITHNLGHYNWVPMAITQHSGKWVAANVYTRDSNSVAFHCHENGGAGTMDTDLYVMIVGRNKA